MLLTSAFLKENSAISLEEWVLVFKVSTTAIRRLRVKCNCDHMFGCPLILHVLCVIMQFAEHKDSALCFSYQNFICDTVHVLLFCFGFLCVCVCLFCFLVFPISECLFLYIHIQESCSFNNLTMEKKQTKAVARNYPP